MKLFAPEYYKHFKCIADKCTHSCCIGWEIDIDEETLLIYENLNSGYGAEVKKSVCYEGVPHFKLCHGERCPHLESGGLCKIIKNLGEDYLCSICREHPRFYNNTAHGKEVGLGMACEEAARIVLSSDGFGDLVEIGEVACETEEKYFDSLAHRTWIFETLSQLNLSHLQKIKLIEERYNITPRDIPDDEWRRIISSFEYLDGEHEKMFLSFSSSAFVEKENEKYLTRAFAYFVYRHCSDVTDEEDFLSALGLCLFCERIFASALSSRSALELGDVVKIARIISEELEYSVDNTDFIKDQFYC